MNGSVQKTLDCGLIPRSKDTPSGHMFKQETGTLDDRSNLLPSLRSLSKPCPTPLDILPRLSERSAPFTTLSAPPHKPSPAPTHPRDPPNQGWDHAGERARGSESQSSVWGRRRAAPSRGEGALRQPGKESMGAGWVTGHPVSN